MADMPERILADRRILHSIAEGDRLICPTEYVRADLLAARDAALAEQEKDLAAADIRLRRVIGRYLDTRTALARMHRAHTLIEDRPCSDCDLIEGRRHGTNHPGPCDRCDNLSAPASPDPNEVPNVG